MYHGLVTIVPLTYTQDNILSLNAVIQANTNITINGTINTLHNGTVQIQPSDVINLEFGTYRIVFGIYDSGGYLLEDKAAALLYEKNMTKITVSLPCVK